MTKWMLFVDGENFTLRGQEFARTSGLALAKGRYWRPDTYLWFPNWDATNVDGVYPDRPTTEPVRAHYYTSAVASTDTLTEIRKCIWALGFSPQVFKKERGTGRTKGVDISLATDMLRGAYTGTYETAVLVAGDGDYVPLVEEVKRQGRHVVVAFYGRANGLNDELRLAADEFRNIERLTDRKWKHYAMHVRKDSIDEALTIPKEHKVPKDADSSTQVEPEAPTESDGL